MAENTAQYPTGGGDSIIRTTAEFREKYAKKRFTSHTAPKAVLYSYLYDVYQQGEGGVRGELYPDLKSIQDKVETYEDMDAWNGYLNLIEWQRSAFNTAVFMRNSLQSNLSELNHIVASLIAAENLRAELKSENLPQASALWLNSLTLEAYSPQAEGYSIDVIRKNIEASHRYMIAYNTFIRLVAEELKVPEYVRLQVTMHKVNASINDVNRALAILTETAQRERAEEPGADYLQATLSAFEPLPAPPPVPADRVVYAKDNIKRGVQRGSYSWYTLYSRYSSKYWRVDVYE
jgi:hypothetical protein